MWRGWILAGMVLATALLCGCDDQGPQLCPPRIGPVDFGPSGAIARLQQTYNSRNYAAFASLFPDDSEAPFRFILCEPLPGGEEYLDLTEFLRIHRRMFQPENPLPGETPLPQDLWLVRITLTLTPVTGWTERPDLYRSPSDPTGLDPDRWRATEAEYDADVLFDTQTDTDYRVQGMQSFVVIEDLTPERCADPAFLLYRWEDLCAQVRPVASSDRTWTAVLHLYR